MNKRRRRRRRRRKRKRAVIIISGEKRCLITCYHAQCIKEKVVQSDGIKPQPGDDDGDASDYRCYLNFDQNLEMKSGPGARY